MPKKNLLFANGMEEKVQTKKIFNRECTFNLFMKCGRNSDFGSKKFHLNISMD